MCNFSREIRERENVIRSTTFFFSLRIRRRSTIWPVCGLSFITAGEGDEAADEPTDEEGDGERKEGEEKILREETTKFIKKKEEEGME